MLAKLSFRKKWQGLASVDRVGRNHRTRRAGATIDVDATAMATCQHGTGRTWRAGMVVRSEIAAAGVRAVTAPCPFRKTGARMTPPAMHFPPS